MIIHETKELLRKTEDVIFEVKEDESRFMKIIDALTYDHFMGYIVFGINAFLIFKTLIIAVVFFEFINLLSLLTGSFNGRNDYLIANFIVSLLIAIIFAPLVASRKSLDDDVKEDFIEKISTYIRDKFYSALQLAAIEKNVEMMKNAFEVRMRIPRGLIGVFWACYIFYLTSHAVQFVGNGKFKIFDAANVFNIFVILLLINMMERLFTRTVRRIYMTLSLALNEVAAEKE